MAGAFSPDGKWLVGSFRQTDVACLRLYDAKTGEAHCSIVPVRPKDLKEDYEMSCLFAPDGRSLAVVSWQQCGIVIYDIVDRKVSRHLDIQASLLAISPDSKTLALRFDGAVVLTSIATGKEIHGNGGAGGGLESWGRSRGEFSPDGKMLALPFECGVQLWDPETGTRIDPHRGPIRVTAEKRQGIERRQEHRGRGRLVRWRESIQLVDAETMRAKVRVDPKGFGLDNPSFSPDGRLLAFMDSSPIFDRNPPPRVRILDVATCKEIIPKETIDAGFVTRWKDNRTLYVTDDRNEGEIRWLLVDFASGKTVKRLPYFKDAIQDLCPPLTACYGER